MGGVFLEKNGGGLFRKKGSFSLVFHNQKEGYEQRNFNVFCSVSFSHISKAYSVFLGHPAYEFLDSPGQIII